MSEKDYGMIIVEVQIFGKKIDELRYLKKVTLDIRKFKRMTYFNRFD